MSNLILKAYAWLQQQSAEAADDEGQGTIEYLLVLGVIVVGIFGLVQWAGLGTAIGTAIQGVIDAFSSNPFA